MMSLDLTKNIKVGTKVQLITNPSHIAIAKEFNGMVSYSNQIKSKIVEVDNGKLFSSIKLNVKDMLSWFPKDIIRRTIEECSNF